MSRWAARWRPGRDPPAAAGAPLRAGRSARNYPHLVAEKLGHDLVDVTYSGATTANVLTDPQHGAPPQIDALDGSEDLVTVTIGGNDVGYVPLLFAAGLPRPMRSLPLLGGRLREQLDPAARDRALAEVAESLEEVGRSAAPAITAGEGAVRRLPDAAAAAGHARAAAVGHRRRDRGRHIADTLERLTAEAAADTGCGLVRVAEASRDHHAWSADPWTTRFGLPLPGRPRRCIPTPPACARSPTWSLPQAT